MRLKHIVKRGVSDVSWLHEFCKSSLNGANSVERVCTEKMENALRKYGRDLQYHFGMFDVGSGNFYLDDTYSLCIIEIRKFGKMVKVVRIYDIKKCIDTEIQIALDKLDKKIKEHDDLYNLYKNFYTLERYANYNQFPAINFEMNTTNKKLLNDFKHFYKLLDEIEDLEEEYCI